VTGAAGTPSHGTPGGRLDDGRLDDETIAWIDLASADGVGPALFARLIAAFGSARGALDAAVRRHLIDELRAREARSPGTENRWLPPALDDSVGEVARRPRRELERLVALGATAVTWRDASYPSRLRGLDDAPPVLFVRGPPSALDPAHAVAIVGTRRPTPAGRSFAGAAAAAIAASGAVVVSGLAYGIDAAAHAAVAGAALRTVAVIGSGLGVLAPAAHRRLADEIVAKGGAIVTELATQVEPTKGTYPRRNRLIAGLADATLVVEAPSRSGALITARLAASLGRDVLVVPGRPWEPTTAGCVALLREIPGSRAVYDVPTLLEDLGLGDRRAGDGAAASLASVLVGLSTAEAILARELRAGPATVDRLATRCRLPVEEVASGLTLLGLRGYAWSSGPLYLAGGALRDAV
jgi:DNA processing protein